MDQYNVTPWSSHPNRYWLAENGEGKARNKYLFLWGVVKRLGAEFFVVNYRAIGEQDHDKVRLIEVFDMSEVGILRDRTYEWSFHQFSNWFRRKNAACIGDPP